MKPPPAASQMHPSFGPAQRADEVFDIVDARDAVVGQATRREVHARSLWHRAVHVLVFFPGAKTQSPSQQRVFLQKRSLAKDSAPGCWDSSCSGHVDAGEGYAPAAVRELAEEIGLVVTGPEALQEVLYLPANEESGWEFVRVYRLEAAGPFCLNPAEIERGEWWTVAEVSAAVVAEPDRFARGFRFVWKSWCACADSRSTAAGAS